MKHERIALKKGLSQLNSGQGESHLLTDRAVSTMLGISVATVRRWRLFGQGPRYIKIGASVRYKPDNVTAWLETCPAGGKLVAEVAN